MQREIIDDPDLFAMAGHRPSEEVYSGCAPSHTYAGPTERAAAERMAGRMSRVRVEVLAWARSRGPAGLTVKEGTRLYLTVHGVGSDDAGSVRNTIGPRLTELKLAGLVTMETKLRREGYAAYVAVPGREDEDGSACMREETP